MIAQSLPTIANHNTPAYSSLVVTLLATGFGHSIKQKAHKRHRSESWRFFVSATSLYGGCVWEAFAPAGFLLPRLTNLHTAATHSFGHERGGSSAKGAVPMNHIHTALKNRAAAHKAMAFAALRADSSASVRLGRYRKHIDRSRTLLALADVIGGEA